MQIGLFDAPQLTEPTGSGEVAAQKIEQLIRPSLAWAEAALHDAIEASGQKARFKALDKIRRDEVVTAARDFAAYRFAAYTCARAGHVFKLSGIPVDAGASGHALAGGWVAEMPELSRALRKLNECFIDSSTISWWDGPTGE